MELIRLNQEGKIIDFRHKIMQLNVTNSDTHPQVLSQQIEWHDISSIVSKGSIWDLTKNYNITS